MLSSLVASLGLLFEVVEVSVVERTTLVVVVVVAVNGELTEVVMVLTTEVVAVVSCPPFSPIL